AALFQNQLRDRWLLRDEDEALVGKDGDFDGKNLSALVTCLGIELLTEAHDVDTSTTERRPDRRSRCCFPSWDLELDNLNDFLCHTYLTSFSFRGYLLDLPELEI